MNNKLLKIDGKSYTYDSLPQHVQQLLEYYNDWNTDLYKLRKDIAKTESAIREALKEMRGEIAKLVATGDLTSIENKEEEKHE
jgi:hypothetical protein